MNKEEFKRYIRNLIDSSVKKQYKQSFYLYYNNSYLRALKLSKITDQTVNIENFTGGEIIFGFNTKNKKFWHYSKIKAYLYASNDSSKRIKIIEEVFTEYDEYKDYKHC